MEQSIRDQMNAVARQFVHAPVDYSFTERELAALKPFFSNVDRKVFFVERMPETVSTSLLSMYSRLKNPRGIRGNWVDSLLLSLLAPLLPECAAAIEAEGDEDNRAHVVQKWMSDRGIKSLDAFCQYSQALQDLFDVFIAASQGYELWRKMANGERIRHFLKMWLDVYGHNSIARMGKLVLCVEDASILVVKSMEWERPGLGKIELSTRYVNETDKGQYPIHLFLQFFSQTAARLAQECQAASMAAYRVLTGPKLSGPFPTFLRERWASIVAPGDLAGGVFGETCDVLGNLLPSSTLTSVAVAMSAEALPQHLKHLYLDDTPEAFALAEFIIEEAYRVGMGSFVRHEQPTPWEKNSWEYMASAVPDRPFFAPASLYAEIVLEQVYNVPPLQFRSILERLKSALRNDYDKLPSQFESVTANIWGVMSFRGWRDLQRQSFCAHLRGRVLPLLGFYAYPKPAPPELTKIFADVYRLNRELYAAMQAAHVPVQLAEYPMALGNLIPYYLSGNLRQLEFCNWQRTDFSVNDEVRQEFLKAEHHLREAYPWWGRLSRADMTPHYVFARGKSPVVLPSE